MMKKLLTVVVLGLSALSFNAAFAHGGGPAKHGGVVATLSLIHISEPTRPY